MSYEKYIFPLILYECPIAVTMIFISGIIGIYPSSHKQKTPGDRGLLLGIRFNIL